MSDTSLNTARSRKPRVSSLEKEKHRRWFPGTLPSDGGTDLTLSCGVGAEQVMSQLNQKGPHRYESQPGSPIPFDVIIPGHTIIDETKGENALIREDSQRNWSPF